MTVRAASRPTAQEHAATVWRRVPLQAVALYGLVAAVVIFLAAPMVALILMSFSTSEFIRFPPVGFSLKWYQRILAMPGFVDSLRLSIQLAAQATALSLLLGVAAA
ncbi:MAG: ABC transporter permease, partial [Chloroflexi bacterium]|nr:ABC transporter permease [Chloroflexota bacterium]